MEKAKCLSRFYCDDNQDCSDCIGVEDNELTGFPFRSYQELSGETDIAMGATDPDFLYYALKLAGEAGEVAEKIGKLMRDNNGFVDDKFREEIAKELGDVLWYLARLSTRFNLDFDKDVAQRNLDKLFSRRDRGVLHGSGDNR